MPKLRIVLAELAILFIPTVVVTLFCQVMDISSQKTAVYSLITIALIACCLYRNWINKHVSSALTVALLFLLSAIFFFNYQNILLKDTGLIKRYKHSADFQAEVGTLIQGARHEIWFFGTDFHISAIDRKDLILERLKSGVKVNYLILNPFAQHIDQIAKDFGSSVNLLQEECRNGIVDLVELNKEWEKVAPTVSHPGDLEIRFFDSTPHARIYVFDPDKTDGRTLYVPYMNRVSSPDLPAYLLANTESGVYSSYFGGIKKLWLGSQPLSSFENDHPGMR
jgi:hypothetical protein